MWVTEEDQVNGCYYCGGGNCTNACTSQEDEPRLLQDETQDKETKGLCKWFASRLDARDTVRRFWGEKVGGDISQGKPY